MAYPYGIKNTDPNFVIDPVTRVITQKSGKDHLMQHDHNSECYGFQIPRFIDGNDMSLCSVSVHYINISSNKTSRNSDYYPVTDITVVGENVVFSWLVSKNATEYSGTLNFTIAFNRSTNDVIDYSWHTDIFKGITISETIQNDVSEDVESYSDILTQWENALFGIADTEEASIKSVSATEQAAIEAKGAATLASIPEDYTTTYNMADEAIRTKADGIVKIVDGKDIIVEDSSDNNIRDLRVFGKSILNGVPAVDTPAEITNIESPTITVNGKNQMIRVDSSVIKNGLRFILQEDGSVIVNGTSTEQTVVYLSYRAKYHDCVLTGAPSDASNDTYCLLVTYSNESEEYVSESYEIGDGLEISNEYYASISILIRKNTQVNNVKFYPMIRSNTTNSDYDPYKPEQTVSLSYVLSGIQVVSDGHYIDESGQEWICDEIDAERGLLIKRIGVKAIGTNGWEVTLANGCIGYVFDPGNKLYRDGAGLICTHCRFDRDRTFVEGTIYENASNIVVCGGADDTLETLKTKYSEATLYYVLATPIETPLTEAELTAFKALHTNYPNTIVLNDAGAHMQLKYNADTKLYIDNKFAELAAKLNSGT